MCTVGGVVGVELPGDKHGDPAVFLGFGHRLEVEIRRANPEFPGGAAVGYGLVDGGAQLFQRGFVGTHGLEGTVEVVEMGAVVVVPAVTVVVQRFVHGPFRAVPRSCVRIGQRRQYVPHGMGQVLQCVGADARDDGAVELRTALWIVRHAALPLVVTYVGDAHHFRR